MRLHYSVNLRPLNSALAVRLLSLTLFLFGLGDFNSSLRAATSIDDPFTDGSRSNSTGGDVLGGVWYQGRNAITPNQLTVANDPTGIGTGNAMQLVPSADSHKVLAFFSPITLANAGDGIEVTFDYRFTTAPASLNAGFRVGLFTSNGTRQTADAGASTTRIDDKGYMVRTNLDSSVADTAIVGEPAGDDILGGNGQITAVGTSAGTSANSGTSKHSMIFRITRQANGDLTFVGQIDGHSPAVGTHGAASAITYSFDEFAFGFAGTGYRPTILVDNVVIRSLTAAPVVVLTSPASEAVFAAPSLLHLTATATSATSTVTKVEFYHGTTKIGESASAPYEIDWLNPAPGVHALTAVACDGQGLRTTSAPVDIRLTGGTPDEFDTLRARWLSLITGGNYNLGDTDVAARVTVITNTAQSNWNSMVKTGGNGRSYLWSDLASTTVSSQVSSNYGRLRAMALAYSSIGSSLQGNASLLTDILGGLEWMYANRYNESKDEYNNWFDWEIGTPLQINDLAVMLYDQLTPTQMMNQMRAIERFTAVAGLLTNNTEISTGANLAWKAQVVTVRGVVVKDAVKLAAARDALSAVFPYVTSGDGFYADGSFIQHDATPYNGAYGGSVIRNLAGTLALTNGSTWAITDPNLGNLNRWVYDSFAPFLFRGAFMDSVRGRDPARSVNQDHLAGHDVITSILAIADFAPPADAANFKAMAKAWIQADTFRSFVSNASMPALIRAKAVLNDNSITPAAEPIVHKQFPGMDRAVHWRPGFAFAVSMCSSRIYNYESGLTQNLRGWYSGDGATYLYNSDIDEYSSNYWPTVNSYRLAGITVDTQARTDGASKGTLSPKNWAGGAEILGLYGSSGMELQATQSTLTARKSWFMFDNEVVALGSGITSTDNRTIETIVENRRLKVATSALTVDGVAKSTALGWSETMTGTGWAHLAATGGYVFPGGATVKGLRETRTGAWYDISNDDTTTVHTNNFATLWFDHGSNPSGAGYSYILLPNQTAAQTAAYAASSDVVVLENTFAAHVVREQSLGITAANFWEDGTHSVGLITVDKKSAVLMHEAPTQVDVSVSDPTQLNSGVVTVELARSATALVSADAQITVLQLTPTIRFTANVNGMFGRTIKASFTVPDTTPLQRAANAIAAAGLTGPAAALDATPHHDGVANLLKYAFNMNLGGPDSATMPSGGTSGLPGITAQPNGASSVFRYEFLRRIGSGLIYTPQKTSDLTNPNSWTNLTDAPTVASINATWERVTYEEPYDAGTTPRLFGRLRVTLPP
jgi:hyaluronate lyase